MNSENQNSDSQKAVSPSEEEMRVAREKEWEKITSKIKEKLELWKVEKNVLPAVIALNALNYETEGSCEGHLNYGYHGPWIAIASAKGAPLGRFPSTMRYVGQKEYEKKIYQDNSISESDVQQVATYYHEWRRLWKPDIDDDALTQTLQDAYVHNIDFNKVYDIEKIVAEAVKNNPLLKDETPEYQEWKKRQQALQARITELLKRFYIYRNRGVTDDEKIVMHVETEKQWEGQITLSNGNDIYEKEGDISRTPEEIRALQERLTARQAEFQAFAAYLKQRFLDNEL